MADEHVIVSVSARMQSLIRALDNAEFETVVTLIEQLPEKERLVMTLYYSEELNLAEIGAAMGLSESRTSRLLASARFRLGEAIRWKTS